MTTENVDAVDLLIKPVSATDLIEEANLAGCENIVSLTEWVEINSGDGGVCVPCDFATIAPWYRDILIKGGEPALAERVDALGDADDDPLHIAEVLDSIKAEVQNDAIRSNLTLYDCMLQTHEEVSNESETELQ